MTSPIVWNCPDWKARLAWTGGLLLAISILFADLMADLISRWSVEPQYSHGFVIPLMAVGLAYLRRHKLPQGTAQSHAAGILLIGVGVVLHVVARYFYVELADCAGLLSCIAGTILLVWGRQFTVTMWPAIVFLAFMFPLPFRMEQMLSAPLQMLGAQEAAWYIQTLGIPAYAHGSTIHLSEVQLGVAEACSGLRMLMVFVAISAATMILSQRTRWEKVLILVSSVPIAMACNITRIIATAAAYHGMGSETADLIFHDLSGWLMMPAAMVLLYLELRLLDWLLVEVKNPLAHVTASQQAPAIPNTISH